MEKLDIICVGTALLDSIILGFDPEPISASGYRAQAGSLNVGGEAVNEALAASKLGNKTGILCFLGEDTAGLVVNDTLKKHGVDTEWIVWEKDCSTPITSMFVKEDGSRMSVTNQSHGHNFHPEQRMDPLDSRAIILGSLFRAPFDDPAIVYSVITAAKKKGMQIFADTKIPNFRALRLEDIADSLPFIDYITPNEDEAKYYTGKEQPEEMADVFLEYGIRNVIIKLGERGCFFKNPKETLQLPAFDIKAVDATGAGDNFIAGFASEKLCGKTDAEALLFANACGAICTTAVGAGTALRDRKQVLELAAGFGYGEIRDR